MTRIIVVAVVAVVMAASLDRSIAGPMPVGLIASGSGDLLLCKKSGHGMAAGSIVKFKQHKDNPTQSRPPQPPKTQ